MKCTVVQELLPLHVGGDLDAKRAQSLIAHLRECADCAASAVDYRESYRLIQDFEPPAFSEEFHDGMRQNVLRQITSESAGNKAAWLDLLPSVFRLRPGWVVATILLVTFSIFAVYFVSDRGRQREIVNNSQTHKQPNHGSQSELPSQSPAASPTRVPDQTDQYRVAGNETIRRQTTPRSTAGRSVDRRSYALQTINNVAEVRDQSDKVAEPGSVPQRNVAVEPAAISAPAAALSEKPLRMEMQTNDSNIRIIWFTYQNAKQDSPVKGAEESRR